MPAPSTHSHSIVEQFPLLRRKSLLHWLEKGRLLHASFHGCLHAFHLPRRRHRLDTKTKIAVTLLHEFGPHLSKRTVYSLVATVEDVLHRSM